MELGVSSMYSQDANMGAGVCVVGVAPQVPPPLNPSSLHILLVMFDSQVRDKVEVLLQSVNYKVTSVGRRRRALELLRSRQEGPDGSKTSPFDLILKDHEPPQVNGFNFLRAMHKEALLMRLPVILISHQDEPEKVAKGLHMGAADYLVQPLRMNELRNLWTHVWRQRHKDKLPPVTVAHLAPTRVEEEDVSTDYSSEGTINTKHREGQGTSIGVTDHHTLSPVGNRDRTHRVYLGGESSVCRLENSESKRNSAISVAHGDLGNSSGMLQGYAREDAKVSANWQGHDGYHVVPDKELSYQKPIARTRLCHNTQSDWYINSLKTPGVFPAPSNKQQPPVHSSVEWQGVRHRSTSFSHLVHPSQSPHLAHSQPDSAPRPSGNVHSSEHCEWSRPGSSTEAWPQSHPSQTQQSPSDWQQVPLHLRGLQPSNSEVALPSTNAVEWNQSATQHQGPSDSRSLSTHGNASHLQNYPLSSTSSPHLPSDSPVPTNKPTPVLYPPYNAYQPPQVHNTTTLRQSEGMNDPPPSHHGAFNVQEQNYGSRAKMDPSQSQAHRFTLEPARPTLSFNNGSVSGSGSGSFMPALEDRPYAVAPFRAPPPPYQVDMHARGGSTYPPLGYPSQPVRAASANPYDLHQQNSGGYPSSRVMASHPPHQQARYQQQLPDQMTQHSRQENQGIADHPIPSQEGIHHHQHSHDYRRYSESVIYNPNQAMTDTGECTTGSGSYEHASGSATGALAHTSAGPLGKEMAAGLGASGSETGMLGGSGGGTHTGMSYTANNNTPEPGGGLPPPPGTEMSYDTINQQQVPQGTREAALQKYKIKRERRDFSGKIRYKSRKVLADVRPRVKGQFVRRSLLLTTPDGVVVVESQTEGSDGGHNGSAVGSNTYITEQTNRDIGGTRPEPNGSGNGGDGSSNGDGSVGDGSGNGNGDSNGWGNGDSNGNSKNSAPRGQNPVKRVKVSHPPSRQHVSTTNAGGTGCEQRGVNLLAGEQTPSAMAGEEGSGQMGQTDSETETQGRVIPKLRSKWYRDHLSATRRQTRELDSCGYAAGGSDGSDGDGSGNGDSHGSGNDICAGAGADPPVDTGAPMESGQDVSNVKDPSLPYYMSTGSRSVNQKGSAQAQVSSHRGRKEDLANLNSLATTTNAGDEVS